ncbi:enolase isoform 3 [Tanacetum coccineum]|uniref:phosphopyruvate hydratase n=1 Tax=Tanacetum coccineum TaxID=301880 RepID=A0ABQ4X9U7_9ASTR
MISDQHRLCDVITELIDARQRAGIHCIQIVNLAENKTLVLPVPAFNLINGGSGNKLAMQEYIILPVGASSFKEAMKMGVSQHLRSVVKKKYGHDTMNVGDEGGSAPIIQNYRDREFKRRQMMR